MVLYTLPAFTHPLAAHSSTNQMVLESVAEGYTIYIHSHKFVFYKLRRRDLPQISYVHNAECNAVGQHRQHSAQSRRKKGLSKSEKKSFRGVRTDIAEASQHRFVYASFNLICSAFVLRPHPRWRTTDDVDCARGQLLPMFYKRVRKKA